MKTLKYSQLKELFQSYGGKQIEAPTFRKCYAREGRTGHIKPAAGRKLLVAVDFHDNGDWQGFYTVVNEYDYHNFRERDKAGFMPLTDWFEFSFSSPKAEGRFQEMMTQFQEIDGR